jgi:hypothetical protein
MQGKSGYLDEESKRGERMPMAILRRRQFQQARWGSSVDQFP